MWEEILKQRSNLKLYHIFWIKYLYIPGCEDPELSTLPFERGILSFQFYATYIEMALFVSVAAVSNSLGPRASYMRQ